MNLKTEIRIKTALGFTAMFRVLALVGNPFIPGNNP